MDHVLRVDLLPAAEEKVDVLRAVELGAQPAGMRYFAWDGLSDSGARALDGQYRFSITASANAQAVTAETLAIGQVFGVGRASDGSATVNLGSLGDKPFADVKQIR